MNNLSNLCRKAILIAGISTIALTNAACANSGISDGAYFQEEASKDEKKVEKRRIKVISDGKPTEETSIVISDGKGLVTVEGKEIKIEDGKLIVDGKVVEEGEFSRDDKVIIKNGSIKVFRDGDEEEIVFGDGDFWKSKDKDFWISKDKNVFKLKDKDFDFDFDFKFDGEGGAFFSDDGEGFVLDLGNRGEGSVFRFHGQQEAIEDIKEALEDVEEQLEEADTDIEREALTSARDSLKSALENMKERQDGVFALRSNAWNWNKDYDKTIKHALKQLEGKRIEIDGARVLMLEELSEAREEIMEALGDVTIDIDIDDDEGAQSFRIKILENALGDLESLEERHIRSLERAEERLKREEERLGEKKERLEERRKELKERLEERKVRLEERKKREKEREEEREKREEERSKKADEDDDNS